MRFLAAAALAACVSGAGACDRRGALAYETNSPNGTYSVEVRGDLSKPKALLNNRVEFAASRGGGGPVVGDLYLAESFTEGFSTLFPKPDWPSENVLRFRRQSESAPVIVSQIYVINRGSRNVSAAVIRSEDLVLLFDLQPGSETQLAARQNDGGFSVDVWVAGRTTALHGSGGMPTEAAPSSLLPRVSLEIGDDRVNIRWEGPRAR